MDYVLLLSIVGLFATYAATKRNRKKAPLYSISLVGLFLTSLYLFIRYGTQEPDSNSAKVYLIFSPILFVASIVLITKKVRQKDKDGLREKLKSIEKKLSLSRFDRIWFGIVFQTLSTLIIWIIILSYEAKYGKIGDEFYSFLFDHIYWQYIYVIPLLSLTYGMRLYRFSVTFFSACVFYSTSLFTVPIIYLSVMEFLSNLTRQLFS